MAVNDRQICPLFRDLPKTASATHNPSLALPPKGGEIHSSLKVAYVHRLSSSTIALPLKGREESRRFAIKATMEISHRKGANSIPVISVFAASIEI